jgi:hypothetical protein
MNLVIHERDGWEDVTSELEPEHIQSLWRDDAIGDPRAVRELLEEVLDLPDGAVREYQIWGTPREGMPFETDTYVWVRTSGKFWRPAGGS